MGLVSIVQHGLFLHLSLPLENDRLKSITGNVCSANRAILLAQDRAEEASVDCQLLEQTLSSLIAEGERMREDLEGVRGEREKQRRRWEEYRRKMEKHRERVEQVERSGPVQTELAELEEKIGMVKERSKASLIANLSLPPSLIIVPSFLFFLSLLPPNIYSLYI